MRQALDSLGRLQEEVGKLWIELRASNGEYVRLVGGWGWAGDVGRGLVGACPRPRQRPVPACSRGVGMRAWMGVCSCVWLDRQMGTPEKTLSDSSRSPPLTWVGASTLFPPPGKDVAHSPKMGSLS